MKNILNILLLFIAIQSSAQNLVPNPSFEDTLNCDQFWDEPEVANPWFASNSSADYFSTINLCGSESWASSFQQPRTGTAMIGSILYYDTPPCSGSEYFEVPLITPLIAGETYYVSFFVSLANASKYAVDKIGAYFSVDTLQSLGNDTCYFPVIPQTESASSTFLSDTLNWMPITGAFVANGGEKFLTIGNFHPWNNTNTSIVSGTYLGAYYYFDDVCVSSDSLECFNTVSVKEFINNEEKTLIRIVDFFGRETEDKPNTLLFFIYSNGTTEKVFRLE